MEMDKENGKKFHFTYHIIACAIRGNPYTADDKTKTTCLIKHQKD